MKKNFPLIAGIAIPILLIIFVALSIYLPGLFAKPKYSFVYAMASTNGPYYNPYFVSNGKLVAASTTNDNFILPAPDGPAYPATLGTNPSASTDTLYIYDVSVGKSHEISFADAQKLSLDPSAQSPDGFQVLPGNSDDSFPFFSGSSDYNSRYLAGRGVSKKIDLPDAGNYYYTFTFLGWINQ